jgi:hypothetical protein
MRRNCVHAPGRAIEADIFKEEGEGGNRCLRRGGAPASHGVPHRRRPCHDQGRTVLTGGGRCFKYRPPWVPDSRSIELVRPRSGVDCARG